MALFLNLSWYSPSQELSDVWEWEEASVPSPTKRGYGGTEEARVFGETEEEVSLLSLPIKGLL